MIQKPGLSSADVDQGAGDNVGDGMRSNSSLQGDAETGRQRTYDIDNASDPEKKQSNLSNGRPKDLIVIELFDPNNDKVTEAQAWCRNALQGESPDYMRFERLGRPTEN